MESWVTKYTLAQFEQVQDILSRALTAMGFKSWETNVEEEDLCISVFDSFTSGQIQITDDKTTPFVAYIFEAIPAVYHTPPDISIPWEESYSGPYDCVAALLVKMCDFTIRATVEDILLDDVLPEEVDVT